MKISVDSGNTEFRKQEILKLLIETDDKNVDFQLFSIFQKVLAKRVCS